MMIFGFLFSAVAAYMAGMVGSSNNPISGVTIATILFSSLLLLSLLGENSDVGASAAIMIGAGGGGVHGVGRGGASGGCCQQCEG